jgi:transcriptional enhancer factor
MYPKSSTSNEQVAGPSQLNNQTPQQSESSMLSHAPPPIMTPAHVYIYTLPPSNTLNPYSSSPAPMSGIHAQDPRPLRAIDPTVSFTSTEQVPCQAIFQIYKAGQYVHEEYTSVSISHGSLSEPGTSAPLFTYSTALVPQYWSYLCEVEGNHGVSVKHSVVG